jgi:monoamine oxidase
MAKTTYGADKTTRNSARTRRQLLTLVGKVGGGAAMYRAMTALGFAAESNYTGPISLQDAPKGSSVLILGAGIAGLVAAYELRRAGYEVTVLEYNGRAGGRAWTIRGGDEYTELGGFKQKCEFDKGLYLNTGPWRIPFHHHAVIDYAKRFGVALEPFIQVNYNAYVHSSDAFQGRPQRYRHVQADYQGHVSELLAKAVNERQLDAELSREDQDKLLESLRSWGALDKQFRYAMNTTSSNRRGYEVDPAGGSMPVAVSSKPIDRDELLRSGLWKHIAIGTDYEFQSTIFQPVGGMDQIAMAMYREVKDLVRFNAKVTKIDQNERSVTVTYVDANGVNAPSRSAKADWCICTIPLSILSQIEVTASRPMLDAIHAVPYAASFKAGLQFKRKFWEQDEQIYGGISYTDLSINRISYPSNGYGQPGKGVMVGSYVLGSNAFEFSAMTPEQRLREVLRQGAEIHPQYPEEFENGISVGWHRVPWTNGCYGLWTETTRNSHYKNLCLIDGRLALAGEHASYLPAWQEGSVLSALDTVQRLHRRIKSGN